MTTTDSVCFIEPVNGRAVHWYEGAAATDRLDEAVVAVLLSVQHSVLDEDGDGSQDEGHKQIHVDEVPGAVELPAEEREET